MVYVDPTIPLPAEPSHTLPRPRFLCPSQVTGLSKQSPRLGTWHFLPEPTDLPISHFDICPHLKTMLHIVLTTAKGEIAHE